VRLHELAQILRSKNAGPLALTLDLLFRDDAAYQKAAESEGLTTDSIARAYGVPSEDVTIIKVPPALAIKITLPRPVIAGSPGDRDVYGAQQHRPLLEIEL
jgi:hypothetical protein